jgi:hypothetical protein
MHALQIIKTEMGLWHETRQDYDNNLDLNALIL